MDNTKQEEYAKNFFEWVKTERTGDVCKFKEFINLGGVEYIVFTDNTRVNSSLIGDVVLMHTHESQIMGDGLQLLKVESNAPRVSSPAPVIAPAQQIEKPKYEGNPVVALLEKSKKRRQHLTLTIDVQLPEKSLYDVVRSNFDNVDEIILDTVYQEIKGNSVRDSLKRELHTLYNPRKKKNS